MIFFMKRNIFWRYYKITLNKVKDEMFIIIIKVFLPVLTKEARIRVSFKWDRENMDVYRSTRSLKLKFVCYKSLLLCYNRIATLIIL